MIHGEFESLRTKTIEKLMDGTCHLFFIEMFDRECLDINEIKYDEYSDVVGIVHYTDKRSTALERLIYWPFKEKSVKNLYI